MNWLKIMQTRKITSNRLDLSITQLLCFTSTPALMYFAFRAVAMHATTTIEVVIGLLGSVVAGLLFVVIGLLLPLASQVWRGSRIEHTIDGQS